MKLLVVKLCDSSQSQLIVVCGGCRAFVQVLSVFKEEEGYFKYLSDQD